MSPTVKKITINAMGIALFVVLSLCLQVPVFDNYYLCLGYVVMAVYCWSVSASSGMIVGTLGVVLYCVLINGLRGMPGWALGNLVLGAMITPAFRWVRKLKKPVPEFLLSCAIIIAANAVAMLGVKSLTECLLYSQPMAVRAATNMTAFIADAFMLIVSLPICRLLDPKIREYIC